MSELLSFVLQHRMFCQARLPSLYSDFRYLKTTNPNGFHANVTAWKSALADACMAGKIVDCSDKLVLCMGEDLIAWLQSPDWGRPLALGVVVQEAVYSKDLYPLNQFLSQRESIYYWSYAGAAFNWGLGRIGINVTNPGNRGVIHGQFVVVKNIEDMAKAIAPLISARTYLADRLFTPDLFASEFTPTISAIDLKVLLCYLSRDRGVCTFNGKIIKLRSSGEQPLMPITEHDTTIAHLKSFLRFAYTRVTTLSADITKYTERVQTGIYNKNRAVALAALKSRKAAEGILVQQVKAIGQVEDVMASIQTATDNIELIQILKRGSTVLNALNKEVGSMEGVGRIMKSLQAEIETVDMVSGMLGESEAVVDEDLVGDELEVLMKGAQVTAHEYEVEDKLNESSGDAPQIGETNGQLIDLPERMEGEMNPGKSEREKIYA